MNIFHLVNQNALSCVHIVLLELNYHLFQYQHLFNLLKNMHFGVLIIFTLFLSHQNPNYQSIQNLGIFTTTHQNILSIGTKVFEIIKVVNSMDFSQFVHLAFEATIVLHQKSYLIHLPIDLVAERYPNQIINAFIQIVTKTSYQGLNNDAYTIFLSLLQKKHLVEFKKIVIEKLFNNADLIIEYISKMINQPQFDADFIFSNAFLPSFHPCIPGP